MPGVVEIAEKLVARAGLSARVKTLPGDYHTVSWPGENDAVLFFGVLHQENPGAIRGLLRRAYEALAPGGLVYVLDMMTDASRARPKFSALFSLNMALTTDHGWVFSEDDLAGWLEQAGFRDFSTRPLSPPMPHWLASARK